MQRPSFRIERGQTMGTPTMITSPSYGRFLFDFVFSAEHKMNLKPTEHPVQSGSSITDHSIMQPDEVILEIGMSDTASGAGSNYSVNGYQMLRAIMQKREPLTLTTRLNTYRDMLITSISAPDDVNTMFALKASIYLQQIKIATVATVSVQQTVSSSKPSTPGGSSSPPPEPVKTPDESSKKKSVLKQIADKVAKATTAAKTAPKATTTKATTKISTANSAKASQKLSGNKMVALLN